MPPKPAEITEKKRAEYCAVLALGASRQTAADYVSVSIEAVRALFRTDLDFARRVVRAEAQFEVVALNGIQAAAKKGRQRTAESWLLERRRPERYERQSPGRYGAADVDRILGEFAELVFGLLSAHDRARVQKAVRSFKKRLHDRWLFERDGATAAARPSRGRRSPGAES